MKISEEQTRKKIHEARLFALRGLLTDGTHRKQWFLERIAVLLGVDLAALHAELARNGRDFESGIAPPEKSLVTNMRAQKKIKYFVFVCACDADSCEDCKKLNGTMWRPGSPDAISVPVKNCKSKNGCWCDAVAVYEEEGTVQPGL